MGTTATKRKNSAIVAFFIGAVLGVCACGALVLAFFLLTAKQTPAATASQQAALESAATNTPAPATSSTLILDQVILPNSTESNKCL